MMQTKKTNNSLAVLFAQLDCAAKCGDVKHQAEIERKIYHQYRKDDQLENAVKHAQNALALYQTLEEPDIQASLLNDLGSLYQQKQNHDKAYESYIRAMQVREKNKDISGMAETRFNLAVLSLTAKNIREAVMGLLESQFVFLTLGKKQEFHKAAQLLGEINNVLSDNDYKMFVKQCSTAIMREGVVWGELEILSPDRIKDIISKLQTIADEKR